MIRSLILNKYVAKEFTKVVINITLLFFCFGFIINLFEEINLFKDHNVRITVPIILLNVFVTVVPLEYLLLFVFILNSSILITKDDFPISLFCTALKVVKDSKYTSDNLSMINGSYRGNVIFVISVLVIL